MGVVSLLSAILCSILGVLYPAYRSFKAIKTHDTSALTKWLIYWIVFSLFGLLQVFTDIFIFWIPLYSELKLIFVLYLVLPGTQGAIYVYRNYVHKYFKQYESMIDKHIAQIRQDCTGQAYVAFAKLYNYVLLYIKKTFGLSLGSPLPAMRASDAVEVDTAKPAGTRRTSAIAALSSYLLGGGVGQASITAKALNTRITDDTIMSLISDSEVFGNEVYGSMSLGDATDVDGLDLVDPSNFEPSVLATADENTINASRALQEKKQQLLGLLSQIERKQYTLRRPRSSTTSNTSTPSFASVFGVGILNGAKYIVQSLSADRVEVPDKRNSSQPGHSAAAAEDVDEEEKVLYEEARKLPTDTAVPKPSDPSSFRATSESSNIRQRRS